MSGLHKKSRFLNILLLALCLSIAQTCRAVTPAVIVPATVAASTSVTTTALIGSVVAAAAASAIVFALGGKGGDDSGSNAGIDAISLAGFQGFTRSLVAPLLPLPVAVNLVSTNIITPHGGLNYHRLHTLFPAGGGVLTPYHHFSFPPFVPFVNPYAPFVTAFPLVIKLQDIQVAHINENDVRQKFLG